MASSYPNHGGDIPLVGLAVKITIGVVYLPTDQTKCRFKEHAEPRLKFYTRYIMTPDPDSFSNFLHGELAISKGLFMIILEDWLEWAARPLTAAIPTLPSKLLGEVESGLGLSMLPIFEDGDQSREFCYVTEHIDIGERPPGGYSRGSLRLGEWEACRKPIATWVKNEGVFTQYPLRPGIVIFGGKSTDGLSKRIEKHYISEGSRRWDRLCSCLPWIYLDLFYVFTNWDSTLEVARFNIEAKEQDMFNRRAIAPIVQQTRELHRDASTTLALQEGLRLHQASIKRFQRGLQSAPDSKELLALRVRMEYVSELLEFYETTCLTILEQQRNLLNLTFNLETVTQSRAVARLNALAIFFLPISFVASIFGITTLEAPAYWYPVAAVPTLLLTAGIAIVLSRSTEHHQDANHHSKFGEALRRPRLIKPTALIPQLTKRDWRSRTNSHIESQPQDLSLSDPSPPSAAGGSREMSFPTPAIVLNDAEDDDIAELEPRRSSADSGRRPTTSNMNLGYRVTGVARVSTGLLSPDPYANAATGALRSPSGSLRHD
ncbi:hypothetical protein F4804DRAFT_76899 [Jackrogersella minutella]|nr:hypothetical protein F4804DRAFT_76899 [Jackrogersella minutella]